MLATDESHEASLSTQAAVELSNSTGSELHLVYVLPEPERVFGHYTYSSDIKGSALENAERESQAFLADQAKKAEKMGAKVTEAHHKLGSSAKEIVSLGESLKASLITIGSRGLTGSRRSFLGSVSGAVVRHAHCPVFVVRDSEKP